MYFDVRSWPAYGELTGQRIDDMEAAGDADPRGKRDPRDFALWKGWKQDSEPETAAWPSPWGRGRPGWHIECSAMALKYLGGGFDIHGGGVDLRFPHHENEQAQSRAAGFDFASYWMHNAWITTAGEKMSKSLGNSLVVASVLERVRGIDLRYYIVAAHYRSHVEFSFEALDEAAAGFARIENFLTRAADVLGEPVGLGHEVRGLRAGDGRRPRHAGRGRVIYDVVREGNKLLAGGGRAALRGRPRPCARCSRCSASTRSTRTGPRAAVADRGPAHAAVDALVGALLEQRATARAAKDFATADAIRDQLKSAGIELEDTPTGPTWSL